jgi:hypothetical protein
VSAAYPDLDKWRRIRSLLTNRGAVRTFDNDFSDRCGLSQVPAWSGWSSLSGAIDTNLAVARNKDGRLEIFAGAGRQVYHNWQTTPSGIWAGWTALGGSILGDPAVGVNSDGSLEVFVKGTGNVPFHNRQTVPGGAWAGWSSLGGAITSNPAVGQNSDGRLEIFASAGGRPLHDWQT